MGFTESWFSLAGAVWLLAIAMLAVASVGLFSEYVIDVILWLPQPIIEIICYAASLGFMAGKVYANKYIPGDGTTSVFIAFTGCIGLLLSLILTLTWHAPKRGNIERAVNVVGGVCSVAWAIVAIEHQSQLIGFISVAALFTALGFTFCSMPFGYVIGFSNKDAIPRVMNIALYLVAFYVFKGISWSRLQVFQTGILFMGPLTFLIGCLIISSKWYYSGDNAMENYVWCNVLCVAALAVCIFVGRSSPELETLYGFGVIFSSLWLADKYIEIPWGQKTWMWGMLGAGALLYAASFYAHLLLEGYSKIVWINRYSDTRQQL